MRLMNTLNTSRRRLWLRYHILKPSVICCWPTGTPACRIFLSRKFPRRIFFWQWSPHLRWYQGHLQRLWCRSNPALVELGCYPCQRSIVGTLRVTVMSCLGTLDANNTVETFITLARPFCGQFFGSFLSKETAKGIFKACTEIITTDVFSTW